MLALRKTVMITLIVIICLSMSCLEAQSRPVTRRLTSLAYTNPEPYGTNSSLETYHFAPGIPTLIDSLSIDRVDVFNNQTHIYRRYVGTIEELAIGTKYDYTIYDLGSAEPTYRNHYYEIFDSSNRLVESMYEGWDTFHYHLLPPRLNIRHYDEAGYADSLYYSDGVNTTFYAKRCFEGGMLIRTDVYKLIGDSWTSYGRYLYTYPTAPVFLSVHLNPYFEPIIYDYDFTREVAMNTKCIPQDITFYRWIEDTNEWVFSGPLFYSQRVSNNTVILSESLEDTYQGYQIDNSFNLSGDLYRREYAGVYGGMHSTTLLTWDRELNADDELIPVVSTELRCYPNPFKQEIRLSIEGSDRSPIELSVYNIRGQLIRKWESESAKEIIWDGKDVNATQVCRGIYLISAKQGNSRTVRRVVKL